MSDVMFANDDPLPEDIAAMDHLKVLDEIDATRIRLGELPDLDPRRRLIGDRLVQLGKRKREIDGTGQPIVFTVTPEEALALEEQRAQLRGPFGPEAMREHEHARLGRDHHELHGTTDPVLPPDTFWDDPDAA